LNVRPEEAVVFEDSVNGVTAARRAGIFVVGVPNPLTAQMGTRGDITISSLEQLSLRDLNEHLKKRR
jgi:putative hydrolase of the HAD superfamily